MSGGGLSAEERVSVLDAGRDTFECRNSECRHDGPDVLTAAVERIVAAREAKARAEVAATLRAMMNEARSEVARFSDLGRDEDASAAELFAVAYRQAADRIAAAPTYSDGTATREHVEDRLDVAAIQAAALREAAADCEREQGRTSFAAYWLRQRAASLTEADPPT